MEIINNHSTSKTKHPFVGYLYSGIVLIVTGIIWMLHNLGILSENLWDVLCTWQIGLMLLGGLYLSIGNKRLGGILILTGALFLIYKICFNYVAFEHIFFPAVCILVGGYLLTFRRK